MDSCSELDLVFKNEFDKKFDKSHPLKFIKVSVTMFLFFIIFLRYFSMSNALWIDPAGERQSDDIMKKIEIIRRHLNPVVNNSCEIKLFDESKFLGDNIGITDVQMKLVYDGEFHRSRVFKNVKSLKILGNCCWEIHR